MPEDIEQSRMESEQIRSDAPVMETEEKLEDAGPTNLADAMREGVKAAMNDQQPRHFKDLDGASKSAVMLLAVGPEAAAGVLKLLTPREVQKLSGRMATVRAVSKNLVLEVLRDFKAQTADQAQVSFDTESFLQTMLHRALGTEGASDLLGKLESTLDMSGVESLRRMEPDVLYEMIKNEHPQIIATVMVFLEPQHAANVTRLFPDELRNELMLRVALLQKVQPSALKELNEVMARSMETAGDQRRSSVGGVSPTAEILNYLSGGMDKSALEKIRSYDDELAELIIEQMFTFEDLIEIDDRSLQTLLLEVPQDTLVLALKGASPKLKEKLFKNMARRAAEAVRDDLETRGPTKISEVEDQQKEVLRIARELADEGRINLERRRAADLYI
jgi:flagellar motor switch protein FliG